jgi:hypothetical protein
MQINYCNEALQGIASKQAMLKLKGFGMQSKTNIQLFRFCSLFPGE